jgi:two-component system, cell cycle sensor histidine kinase and response regulator CckA
MAVSEMLDVAGPPRILVVEDERIVAMDLAATLQELGYEVVGMATRGEDAVQRAAELQPELILMDVRLAGKLDGIQAAEIIHRSRDVPVVYLTAHSDNETLRRAAATAASGYLVKPFKSPELRCTIEVALHKHAADMRVREHEQWLHTTLHSIAEAVIATDIDGCVKLFNPVAEHLTGWSRSEAQRQPLVDILSLVDEQSGNPLANPLEKPINLRAPWQTHTAALISRSGAKIAIEETAAPIVDAFGRTLGAVLVLRDVTEQRSQLDQIQKLNEQLEHRVSKRTADLASANRDLEAFSYSVAHDLRAPLRSIDSFSTLLTESQKERLDAQGTGYLDRIRAATARMGQLIDDLLMLAGIGSSDLHRARINVPALARELAQDVAVEHAPHHVDFYAADSPLEALADVRLLKIALRNLLDNAWKFTRNTAAARVELHTTSTPAVITYCLRDNGAGFDSNYASKLFSPFQRLHSEREFPGTGIGLAIVERVIRKHGGKVWAQSEVGKGAAFFFTLPNPHH